MLSLSLALVPLTLLQQALSGPAAEAPAPARPLFRELMGLNGHTIQFKANRYAEACRAIRDYHPFDWDTGDDTSTKPPFPSAKNGVDWKAVYGSWKTAGCETDACIMFDNLPVKKWKDPARDARAYGEAFASAFGPSSTLPLVSAVEVGNEPGLYDDATYRAIFEHMARGLRRGDARLKIGTCAITTGSGDRYAKSVKCILGLESLYDYLSIHTYAEVEGWPTWRRTYPEDPKVDYLRRVIQLIEWRDRHAPGKEIRVTEFGWDATTKPAPATGDFAKWVGSTETQQAQYLVRSFLLFSKLDVTRAYIFFFDDKDEPQVHGSSGLTRNGEPKPAFHAVTHLRKVLGDYFFTKVVREDPGEVYIYEYVRDKDAARRVWAAWSPTGVGRTMTLDVAIPGMKVLGIERMPLSLDVKESIKPDVREGKLVLRIDESPVYIRLEVGLGDR
jgi:hypothetical protein